MIWKKKQYTHGYRTNDVICVYPLTGITRYRASMVKLLCQRYRQDQSNDQKSVLGEIVGRERTQYQRSMEKHP